MSTDVISVLIDCIETKYNKKFMSVFTLIIP